MSENQRFSGKCNIGDMGYRQTNDLPFKSRATRFLALNIQIVKLPLSDERIASIVTASILALF